MTQAEVNFGVCGHCRQAKRLTGKGLMHQHWRRGWPRRLGHPPCPGSAREPVEVNPQRNTWWNQAREGK